MAGYGYNNRRREEMPRTRGLGFANAPMREEPFGYGDRGGQGDDPASQTLEYRPDQDMPMEERSPYAEGDAQLEPAHGDVCPTCGQPMPADDMMEEPPLEEI